MEISIGVVRKDKWEEEREFILRSDRYCYYFGYRMYHLPNKLRNNMFYSTLPSLFKDYEENVDSCEEFEDVRNSLDKLYNLTASVTVSLPLEQHIYLDERYSLRRGKKCAVRLYDKDIHEEREHGSPIKYCVDLENALNAYSKRVIRTREGLDSWERLIQTIENVQNTIEQVA